MTEPTPATSPDESAPGLPTEGLPVAPIHDFVRKLRQGPFHERVVDYVAWQKARRQAKDAGEALPAMPAWAPLSINLDLTTACNYACDHCIDWDTLNSGINYEHDKLLDSLRTMADGGLKSVILIGGGEPTVYPKFREMVRFLKDLGMQVAVVSNGSRNDRILDVVDCMDENDWVRLSLDSGTDPTFQAMHKPKKAVTLEEICAGIPPIKAKNPKPRIGFSFVITWEGSERGEGATPVVENLDEIPRAARLAKDHGFDYISFKPFLTRTDEGAEVMDPEAARRETAEVVARIESKLVEARELADDDFAVLESINLKLLATGAWRDWTTQPRMCHMQAMRQVLSPLGLWNCPAHRGVRKARMDAATAFSTPEATAQAGENIANMLESFDASHECREVTCLYHDTNWWIERAVESEGGLADGPVEDLEDYFL